MLRSRLSRRQQDYAAMHCCRPRRRADRAIALCTACTTTRNSVKEAHLTPLPGRRWETGSCPVCLALRRFGAVTHYGGASPRAGQHVRVSRVAGYQRRKLSAWLSPVLLNTNVTTLGAWKACQSFV